MSILLPVISLIVLLLWSGVCFLWGAKLAIEDKKGLERTGVYTYARDCDDDTLSFVTAISLFLLILFL